MTHFMRKEADVSLNLNLSQWLHMTASDTIKQRCCDGSLLVFVKVRLEVLYWDGMGYFIVI